MNSSAEVLSALEGVFQTALTQLPLELSVFLLSILEEIIVPIPAPILLFSAGSLIQERGGILPYLLFIAMIAALGKTIGTWGIYVIADKAEHFIFSKYGKVLGVSSKQIDGIRKYFTGTWRDLILLFVLRAVPVIPTAHVSAFCGIITFQLRKFLIVTYFGLLVRQFFFLYIGYQGKEAYEAFNRGYGNLESVMGLIIMGLIIGLLVFWISNKKKR